jgi:hypothetical protein
MDPFGRERMGYVVANEPKPPRLDPRAIKRVRRVVDAEPSSGQRK